MRWKSSKWASLLSSNLLGKLQNCLSKSYYYRLTAVVKDCNKLLFWESRFDTWLYYVSARTHIMKRWVVGSCGKTIDEYLHVFLLDSLL